MNAIRVLTARILRIGSPLLMLALIPAVGAPPLKKYVLLSAHVEQDLLSNGVGTDQTTEVTNHYDQQGNLVDTLIVGSGNFDQVQTTTYVNDANGDPITSTVEVDNDGDGDVDLTAISTFSYDSQGKRIAIDQLVYNDADPLTIMRHTSFGYDAQGNLTSVVTASDIAVLGLFDGVVDQITTVENTWDSNGRLLQTVTRADLNGDGDTLDQGESVETRVNTFDGKDRIASALITAVRMNGGVPILSTATATFTYQGHGLLTELQTIADTNADGTIDQIVTTTNTWGKK
ncbi:MAG: hypothetical protein ABIZ81_08305 [Opitutaceae bacterium]